EHERLDCDGNCSGRLQSLAEIDKVEVVKYNSVDGNHVVLYFKVVLENGSHQPCEVTVEDQIDRPSAAYRAGQAFHHTTTEGGDADGCWRSVPVKYQRDLRLSLLQIKSLEMTPDGLSQCRGIDAITHINRGPQHLEVLTR